MLSATIGPQLPPTPAPQIDLTAEPAAPVGMPVKAIVLVPVVSDFDAPNTPHGDGPEFDLRGPQVHFDGGPIPPPPLMGISVAPSSIPGELYVHAWKANDPAESKPLLTEFGGSIRVGALPQFLSYVGAQFDPGPYYIWPWETPPDRGEGSLHIMQPGSSQPAYGTGGEQGKPTGQVSNPAHNGIAPKGEPNNTGYVPVLPLDFALYAPFNGQGASSTSISQRASDNVIQSYTILPIPLTFDIATASAIGSVSASGDTPLTLDENQSGFVQLDGSNPSDLESAARADYDAEAAAIDAVLADLHDFYPANDGNSGPLNIDTNPNAIAADSDAAMQGGMVLLRSTATADGNVSSIASTGHAPIDWSAPDGKVQMDVTVGVYQAFDVASSELTSAKTSLPAAIIVPTKQHEQATRINVSADKDAKPTKDQASAWVEMFTAAAVVGATKRKRKTRSQA
jgi:hypothetical protein